MIIRHVVNGKGIGFILNCIKNNKKHPMTMFFVR